MVARAGQSSQSNNEVAKNDKNSGDNYHAANSYIIQGVTLREHSAAPDAL